MDIYRNSYQFIEDSYTSLGGYRCDWDYSYLIPYPTELTEFFNDRKQSAVLENIYQPLQDLFLDPIKAVSHKIELNTPRKDLKFIFDESQVSNKCNDMLVSLKLNDITVYATSVEAIDDRINLESIPDVENIPVKNVEELVMNGLTVKSGKYIEYQSYKNVYIPIKVTYSNNYFEKITMAWINIQGQVTLKDLGDSKRITMFDDLRYGVLNKFGGELGKIPISFSLANQQKLLFNMDNQRLATLRKYDFPLFVIKTDEDILNMDLSTNTMMKIGLDSEYPQYLEASLNGVEITTEILEEKKAFIYKTFTKDLMTSNIQYTSAVSSVIASQSFTSTVELFYELYKILLQNLVENIKFIYSMNETKEVIDFPSLNLLSNTEIDDQVKNSLGL